MGYKKIDYTLFGTATIWFDEGDSLEDVQALVCDREDKKAETAIIKGINWELTELAEAEEDDFDSSDDEDYEELDFE